MTEANRGPREGLEPISDTGIISLSRIAKAQDFKPFAQTRAQGRAVADAVQAFMTPQFDATFPAQEELAIQFCEEIAGRRGEAGTLPDPVRLLEMAEQLYWAEINSK